MNEHQAGRGLAPRASQQGAPGVVLRGSGGSAHDVRASITRTAPAESVCRDAPAGGGTARGWHLARWHSGTRGTSPLLGVIGSRSGVLCWHSSWIRLRRGSSMALPPGPRSPALFQMLAFLWRPERTLLENMRRYGHVHTIKNPILGPQVIVSEPELIKQVFTGDPDVYQA